MNGFYYVWFHAMCVALPASRNDPTDDAAGLGWLILVLDVTAKVVYGFVATARFKKLPDGTPEQTRRYG